MTVQWSAFVRCFVCNKPRVKCLHYSNDTVNTSIVITRTKRDALHLILLLTGIHRLLITSQVTVGFSPEETTAKVNPRLHSRHLY